MTDKSEDGGPAFPSPEKIKTVCGITFVPPRGMSLRQYAAIKLKVPDSGLDWLDEMIVKSRREEIAGQVMQGLMAAQAPINSVNEKDNLTVGEAGAKICYGWADAMLKVGKS